MVAKKCCVLFVELFSWFNEMIVSHGNWKNDNLSRLLFSTFIKLLFNKLLITYNLIKYNKSCDETYRKANSIENHMTTIISITNNRAIA